MIEDSRRSQLELGAGPLGFLILLSLPVESSLCVAYLAIKSSNGFFDAFNSEFSVFFESFIWIVTTKSFLEALPRMLMLGLAKVLGIRLTARFGAVILSMSSCFLFVVLYSALYQNIDKGQVQTIAVAVIAGALPVAVFFLIFGKHVDRFIVLLQPSKQ